MSCRNMASSKITLRFEPKFPGPTPFSYPSSAAMRGTCAYPSLGSLLIFLFSWLGSWARTANSQRKGSFNCNQLSALPKGIPRWNKVYSQVEMVWHGNIMKNRHDKNASDLKKASWGGVVAPRGTIRTILLHVVLQTRGEHHQSATTSLINLTCQAQGFMSVFMSCQHKSSP